VSFRGEEESGHAERAQASSGHAQTGAERDRGRPSRMFPLLLLFAVLLLEAGDVTLSGRFSGGGRVTVETGDIIARLPPEDTRDLTLETCLGSVLREPADGAETKAQQGS
jgi:hypothetical protein